MKNIEKRNDNSIDNYNCKYSYEKTKTEMLKAIYNDVNLIKRLLLSLMEKFGELK